MRTLVPVLAMLLASHSLAQPAVSDSDSFFKDWHVGLNVRADVGTHPVRIDGGVRARGWDFIVVLDPMFWTDGQFDADAIVARRSEGGWQALLGWRLTSIGIADGAQLQEKLLLGAGADLPHISDFFRATGGFELALLLVKHGGGLPTESISFKSARSYIDFVNFGLFLRFEFTRRF